MSENCGNPNCPTHGNSAEAKADRANRQHIAVNEELMSVIRLLASNIHTYMAPMAGLPPEAIEFLQKQIISGAGDDDPMIQGLVGGFMILLRDHHPTQQFVGLCSQVEEKDNVLTRKLGRPASDFTPVKEVSISELMDLLRLVIGRR